MFSLVSMSMLCYTFPHLNCQFFFKKKNSCLSYNLLSVSFHFCLLWVSEMDSLYPLGSFLCGSPKILKKAHTLWDCPRGSGIDDSGRIYPLDWPQHTLAENHQYLLHVLFSEGCVVIHFPSHVNNNPCFGFSSWPCGAVLFFPGKSPLKKRTRLITYSWCDSEFFRVIEFTDSHPFHPKHISSFPPISSFLGQWGSSPIINVKSMTWSFFIGRAWILLVWL